MSSNFIELSIISKRIYTDLPNLNSISVLDNHMYKWFSHHHKCWQVAQKICNLSTEKYIAITFLEIYLVHLIVDRQFYNHYS